MSAPRSDSDAGHFSSQNTEDSLKDRLMFGELNPCGGGDPIPLQKQRLVVGRQPSCDIILRFPNVSSRHCEFQLLNGYWHVRDLGSRNGIKVNGIRCESHWLMPGDVLSVAKHRYEVNYSSRGRGPAAGSRARSVVDQPARKGRPEPPRLARTRPVFRTRRPKTRRSPPQRHAIDGRTQTGRR